MNACGRWRQTAKHMRRGDLASQLRSLTPVRFSDVQCRADRYNARSGPSCGHETFRASQGIGGRGALANCQNLRIRTIRPLPSYETFPGIVVEEALAGRSEQLCEYVIGLAVFDQVDSFRNDARRLRQKLLEYYRQSPPGVDQLLIEISKGGYVPDFHPPPAGQIASPGNRPRLQIQITSSLDGAEIWTGEFDCELNETLCLEIRLTRNTNPIRTQKRATSELNRLKRSSNPAVPTAR